MSEHWVMKDGKQILIADMDLNHTNNVLNILDKQLARACNKSMVLGEDIEPSDEWEDTYNNLVAHKNALIDEQEENNEG